MTSDARIQPALWHLPAEPMIRAYRAAIAPKAWKEAFPRPDRSPPLVPLATALLAVAPTVRYAAAGKVRGGEPFLWADPDNLPAPGSLAALVEEWVAVAFDDAHRPRVLNAVRNQPLSWEDVTTIDLAAWTPGPNGTATPVDQLQYPLLAVEVATLLEGTGLDVGGRHLDLLRVVQCKQDGKEQLVSWPPEHESRGKGTARLDEYWCLQMDVKVATIAWDPDPRIHIDVSRRRFLSRPTSWVPPGMGKQRLAGLAHWPAQLPLHLAGLHAGDRAIHVSLGWKPAHDGKRSLGWYDATGVLLGRLDLDANLDPSALAANPLNYRPERGRPTLLAGFRNGFEPGSRLGHGFWQVDHRLLHDAVTSSLSLAGYAPEEVEATPSRPNLTRRMQPAVHGRIEPWCQTSEAAAAVLAAVEVVCGPATGHHPDGRVEFQSGTLIVEPHAVPPDWVERLPEATSTHPDPSGDRTTAVASVLTEPDIATVAIVELDPKQHYRRRPEQDPFLAVRRGVVASGRGVQGLETSDPAIRDQANIIHRGRHATFDAFRQLGTQFLVPERLSPVAGGVRQVAIVPISRNYSGSRPGATGVYPVGLVIEPNGDTKAIAYGDDEPCSLHHVFLRLATAQVPPLSRDRRAAAGQWSSFVDHLIDQLRGGPPTLLLVERHANWWRCLSDKHICVDRLPIPGPGLEPALGTYAPHDIPNLRAVRIDPAWVRHAGFLNEGNIAPTHGLYQVGARRFLSRGHKPLTRKVRENRSVFAAHSRRATVRGSVSRTSYGAGDWITEPREPFKDAWNPATSEYVLFFLQPGDDANEWAVYLHAQRHVAVQYADPLSVPAVLHNAQLMGDYLTLAPQRKAMPSDPDGAEQE